MTTIVELWWIPLGAGGRFVRNNGLVYEAWRAWREGRPRADLYHTALTVRTPQARYVIEDAWPIPDGAGASRGVVAEGPVFARAFARWRTFRYEVRCWREGTIFDAAWAVDSPQPLTQDPILARRVLASAAEVPTHVWGRKLGGDMWNSNSVISWILTRAGVPLDAIVPPAGGRAPGWDVGIAVAREASLVAERNRRSSSIVAREAR